MTSSQHRNTFAVSVAIVMVAAVGCSNEAIPGPGPKVPDFTVNVSTSTNLTPQYSWDAGNVASLRVSRTDAFSDSIAWLIVTENANGPVNNITSPVTHGVTPPGAQVDAANELVLQAGRSYQVTAAKANGTAGFTEFTCCN